MASLIAWQRVYNPAARTVDLLLGMGYGPDFNNGTPEYPFQPSLQNATIAYGGGPVGNHKHDDFLRLVPFPRPPVLMATPSPARSPLGLNLNPFGGSYSQGPGAPVGGR